MIRIPLFVVPQYPYCLEEDRHSEPLDECLYARSKLFFTCHLRPAHGRLSKNIRTKTALMTFKFATTWFSSVPLKCLTCPSKGAWKMLKWSSCMSHPLRFPYTLSVCGSCQCPEYGWQSPPDPLISRGKLNFDLPHAKYEILLFGIYHAGIYWCILVHRSNPPCQVPSPLTLALRGQVKNAKMLIIEIRM